MIRMILILAILSLWLVVSGCAYEGDCCGMEGDTEMACCDDGTCDECTEGEDEDDEDDEDDD